MSGIAVRCGLVAALVTLSPTAMAADAIATRAAVPDASRGDRSIRISQRITGQAAVIDGHTLWFPQSALMVRLTGIDTCELPQWSYDPMQHEDSGTPKPVPCGPLAKAWLKRTVGSATVTCDLITLPDGGFGRCRAAGTDLANEMLRVGWARVGGPSPAPSGYLASQHLAMAARYGMWATYVLDIDEWRVRAVDQTLSRRPIADFNLLAERKREISPPFQDARRLPVRKDR